MKRMPNRAQEPYKAAAAVDWLAGGELPWSVKHFDPVKPMWLLTQPDPSCHWLGLDIDSV
jgi:hypothetical protein